MEIQATRSKFVLLFLILVGLLWLLRFITSTDEDADSLLTFFRSLLVAFLAAGSVVCVVNIIRPPRLRMEAECFTIERPFRSPETVYWEDIDEFFHCRIRLNNLIGYRLKPAGRGSTVLDKLNTVAGAEGLLPTNWPIPTAEMIDDLNARVARSRAGNRSA